MARRVARSLKTARKELERLLKERERLYTEMDKQENEGGLVAPHMYSQLQVIENKIREVQEFCSLEMLGALRSESRRLSRLTIALIALTAVLTILTALLTYLTSR